MNLKYRKKWNEVLAILDNNLDVEEGIITNRFATATKIVNLNEALQKSHKECVEALRQVSVTISTYGHMDRDTDLHDKIFKAITNAKKLEQ